MTSKILTDKEIIEKVTGFKSGYYEDVSMNGNDFENMNMMIKALAIKNEQVREIIQKNSHICNRPMLKECVFCRYDRSLQEALKQAEGDKELILCS